MRLRMKNFKIIQIHWKIQFLGGRVHEKPIYREKLLKTGGLGQLSDLRGALEERGDWFLKGGWGGRLAQCTLCLLLLWGIQVKC